jgi:hypothetical protein
MLVVKLKKILALIITCRSEAETVVSLHLASVKLDACVRAHSLLREHQLVSQRLSKKLFCIQ